MGGPFPEILEIIFSFPVSRAGKYFTKTLKEAAFPRIRDQIFSHSRVKSDLFSRFHVRFLRQSRCTLIENGRSRVTLRPH